MSNVPLLCESQDKQQQELCDTKRYYADTTYWLGVGFLSAWLVVTVYLLREYWVGLESSPVTRGQKCFAEAVQAHMKLRQHRARALRTEAGHSHSIRIVLNNTGSDRRKTDRIQSSYLDSVSWLFNAEFRTT